MNAPTQTIGARPRVRLDLRPRSTVARMRALKAARPETRGDCVNGIRPCPWASCRHHMAHVQKGFRLGLREDLDDTCVLDIADRGPVRLEDAARATGFTREMIRQIESAGLVKLRAVMPRFVDSVVDDWPEAFGVEREPVEVVIRREVARETTDADIAMALVSMGWKYTANMVRADRRRLGLVQRRKSRRAARGFKKIRADVATALRKHGGWMPVADLRAVVSANGRGVNDAVRWLRDDGRVKTRLYSEGTLRMREHRWIGGAK